MNNHFTKAMDDPNLRHYLKKCLEIQYNAYKTVCNRASDIFLSEDVLLLSQFGSSREEIETKALKLCERYIMLMENPREVLLLPYQEICTLRHILWRMEDDWLVNEETNIDPYGTTMLWQLFFDLEEYHKPEICLTLNISKYGKVKS